jgi:GMP synthase-like glutamine amidotransferase
MAPSLHLCLVDMNNGVPNEATRCFRTILERFTARARAVNPTLDVRFTHVQPRNLGEAPPPDVDLVLSSGGPGSPFDGYDEPWCTGYRRFLDSVVDAHVRGKGEPSALVVCHSFEIAIEHFGFARMAKRASRKFGLMPVYTTPEGARAPLLEPFGDRLFVWEHRDWEAVGLDHAKLAALGGELWAVESRPDGSSPWKGDGLLAFRFAPGVEGTQFHPEADRDGALAWIQRPEQATACIEAYGELTYQRMLASLDNPERLARTFEVLIPGWLDRAFDGLAARRGYKTIGLTSPRPEPSIVVP